MQTGIDLAGEPDRTVCTAMMSAGEPAYPPHRCAGCAWHRRGGEDCNEPNGGLNCKLYAPNAEAMEQARALIRQLQLAYRLHLCGRRSKRLPWLERAIDQLQAIAEGGRPRG